MTIVSHLLARKSALNYESHSDPQSAFNSGYGLIRNDLDRICLGRRSPIALVDYV